MALDYREKMSLTAAFLKEMRLRLADKAADVLPPEGTYYYRQEPHRRALVGCLGPMPSPDYTGPQAPNSMGIVVMVTPDDKGEVSCEFSGQFDVVHRYIPDVADMAKDRIGTDDDPGKKQVLHMAFRRYTVKFENLKAIFSVKECNEWLSAGAGVAKLLHEHTDRWLQDPRVMRRCKTGSSGAAKFRFDFSEAAFQGQQGLNDAVYGHIIDKPGEVLLYAVNVRGRLRPAPAAFGAGKGPRYLLEVFIENQTSVQDTKPFGVDFPALLDARLSIDLTAGQAHKVPHRLMPEDYRFLDDDGLPGYGITCGIVDEDMRRFHTDSMPTVAQPRVDAPDPKSVGMQDRPRYDLLASDPMPVLDQFKKALNAYLGTWEERIAALATQGLLEQKDIALADRDSFAAEVKRIEDGIELLERHEALRRSFQLMNESMSRAIKLQGKSFDSWHLFQLGFILTQVRTVFERHAPAHERRGSVDRADVLWFATGGGKTEAYLGIISMALLYGRVCGREYGTTAWMRFPLRMLSVQQFQRLSYVLAQTNMIRQREGLGGWPFTIGYYTGDGTPNMISVGGQDDSQRGYLPTMSEERLKSYQFISDCPYCGKVGSVTVMKDIDGSRIRHVCQEASCWSNSEAAPGMYGEGIRGEIGIYISDEEVYRYLPSVLVGTVDKLAVIAYNKRFANFFGVARHICPEHGVTRSTTCEHRRLVQKNGSWESKECGNNTRTSTVVTRGLAPMKDPGFPLLVQDELHLLRESLGNFDAHYETLLTQLQVSHGGQSPKVLAATATIKDFEDHIHHLYLKEAVRFPAPGVTLGESFYARKAKDSDGTELVRRWFAGILPIGRSRVTMSAVAEVSSAFLDQVDSWRTRLAGADKALLENLGLGTDKAGDALAYIEKNLNSDLVYANSKRSITEVLRYFQEIQGRTGLQRDYIRLDAETPLDSILKAIHHVESKAPTDSYRHLIATSVVSHGVDIAELNFMVMSGWPKTTAEYIQSSARSGRVHPGVVVCVLSSHQLFETTVFLSFKDYHRFLDKLVDSVPINRFAPNVLRRTLPGVISAVVQNWAALQPWGKDLNHNVKPLVDLLNDSASGGKAAEQLKDAVKAALRIPAAIERHFDARVIAGFNVALKSAVDEAFYALEHWPPGKLDQRLAEALGDIDGHRPLRSFRDIENQIAIRPASTPAERVLAAMGR